jgi:lysophospholipase L1-like esterase
MRIIFILFLSMLACTKFSLAQERQIWPDTYLLPELDTIRVAFPFLNLDSNSIGNERYLKDFFFKLQHNKEQITIAHIGDSHIQAGFFSGIVRQELQKKFGNAGYGHFFPYGVARSNSPAEVQSYTQTTWTSRRNSMYSSLPLELGLSGYTLQTYSPAATIRVQLSARFSFDELLVFHSKTPSDFRLKLTDREGKQIGDISMEPEQVPTVSRYHCLFPVTEVVLKPVRTSEQQKKFTLYGLACRSMKDTGVVYHSIGVNGAEYRHYNNSEHFFQHLEQLNPDLLIVSLGTNEAYNYLEFSKEIFYNHIDNFVKNVRKKNPHATLLLTVPGASHRRAGKFTQNNLLIEEAREVIVQYCKEKNMPYWDWYQIMGGRGSIEQWSAAGLTDRAKVHYSAKGYRMQGYLFFEALMKAYQNNLSK